jgi:hypothetical protein
VAITVVLVGPAKVTGGTGFVAFLIDDFDDAAEGGAGAMVVEI